MDRSHRQLMSMRSVRALAAAALIIFPAAAIGACSSGGAEARETAPDTAPAAADIGGPLELSPGPRDESGTTLEVGAGERYLSNIVRVRNKGDRPVTIEEVRSLRAVRSQYTGAALVLRNLASGVPAIYRGDRPAFAGAQPLDAPVAPCPVDGPSGWELAPACELALLLETTLEQGAAYGWVAGFEVTYSVGGDRYRTRTGFVIGMCDPELADGCEWPDQFPPPDDFGAEGTDS